MRLPFVSNDVRRHRVISIVDDDLEVVIQFLTDVPPQLGGHNPVGIGVETSDAEGDLVFVVNNTDLGSFSRGLPFIGLTLQEVGNWIGLLPKRIIERAIQLRSPVDTAGLRSSQRCLRPHLPLGHL